MNFEELKKLYIETVMSEMMDWHNDKYVQFSEVKKLFLNCYKGILNLSRNCSEPIKTCWDNHQNAMFPSNVFNLIFEIDNEDFLTAASFNPLTSPYELCVNCTMFKKDKDLSRLLKFLETDNFKVLLAHEICHLCQTKTYGASYMKKHIEKENNGQYDSSIVELEACLFMLIESASLKGKKLKDSNDVFSYAESNDNSFLQHASEMVLKNKSDVLNILEHNDNFLTEANEFAEEESFEMMFDPNNCIPVPFKRK